MISSVAYSLLLAQMVQSTITWLSHCTAYGKETEYHNAVFLVKRM